MHGYSCGGCGVECSGMGKCETCNCSLCFLCAESTGSGRERKTFCPDHAPADSTDMLTATLQAAFPAPAGQ